METEQDEEIEDEEDEEMVDASYPSDDSTMSSDESDYDSDGSTPEPPRGYRVEVRDQKADHHGRNCRCNTCLVEALVDGRLSPLRNKAQ